MTASLKFFQLYWFSGDFVENQGKPNVSLFLLLAVGTAIGFVFQLGHRVRSPTTFPGIAISAWMKKLGAGTALENNTVLSDTECSEDFSGGGCCAHD